MFKKELPIIFIGLCVVIAALVLGWSVFVKTEVPVQIPVVNDGNDDDVVDDDVLDDTEDNIDDDVSEVDTSDWKVYRNEEYNYELKYPSNWTGVEESSTTAVASFTIEKGDAARAGFWIYVYENPKELSAKEWWDQEFKKGKTVYYHKDAFQISGITADIYESESGLEFSHYVFNNNSRIYNISTSFIDSKIRKILSTFKFIEKDNTADWKRYKNEEYGVEFKYPDSWCYEEIIPQPSNFGIRVVFNDSGGNIAFALNHPILEIGYEAWILSETEKTDLFTKMIFRAKPENKEFGNLILVEWHNNKWENSGQFTLSYKEENDPRIEIFDEILSTFKFIEKDEVDKNYKLDCTDKPDSFQLKYSWYDPLRNKL